MLKRFLIIWGVAFVLLIYANIDVPIGGTSSGTSIIDDTTFVDDVGNLIKIDHPYTKIISLYNEHTENLYQMGMGDAIIGVDSNDNYPYEVTSLPHYDYTLPFDVEEIIKAAPDLVLIAPSINKAHPSAVTQLETAGLKVVSLRPDTFDDFDIYIKKLGMLTGNVAASDTYLEAFYSKLNAIIEKAKTAETSPKVFFESSENGYLTASNVSLPYLAIESAGGINIAGSPEPIATDDEYAFYGEKKIMTQADDIDIYLTLQGVSTPGASIVSILQKEAFSNIKAVKDNKLYEMDELIIDSYTSRYLLGVHELARYFHPEVFDDLSAYNTNAVLTRGDFAKIIIKALHVPIYINTSSTYYDYERFNHVYGSFTDVSWTDDDFNEIETSVMRSYLKERLNANGEPVFDREGEITRADVAAFLNIYLDIHNKDEKTEIADIEGREDAMVIQRVVDNGLMAVENGEFKPDETYTNSAFITFLETVLTQYNEE